MFNASSLRPNSLRQGLVVLLTVCCTVSVLARQQQLTSEDAEAFLHGLGRSMAIDGDLVALGAPFYGKVLSSNTGGVFLFQRSSQDPTVWNEVDPLLASDGVNGDRFGWAVDIDGEVIAVGASEDTLPQVNQGSVYIFRPDAQSPGQWEEVAKFFGNEVGPRDLFGSSVDLQGDRLAVGAPGENSRPGAVYIFERATGPVESWSQIQHLEPSATHPTDNEFGFDIALDGDVLAVASSARPTQVNLIGAVFIYHRDEGGPNNWGLVKTLQTGEISGYSAFFATSIALHDDVLVVGDTGYEPSPDLETGGVYVFRRNQGGVDNWGQEAILISPNGGDNDRFGRSIDFDGSVLAAGSPFDDSAGFSAGSITLFDATLLSPWPFVSELVPLDLEDEERGFGEVLAIDQGVLVTRAEDVPFPRNYINYDLHFPTQDPNALFVNGFESGDTTSWSGTTP